MEYINAMPIHLSKIFKNITYVYIDKFDDLGFLPNLLERYEISCKIKNKQVFVSKDDGEKSFAIRFLKVKQKYQEKIERAFEEIKPKNAFYNSDYREFCEKFFDGLINYMFEELGENI